MLETDAPDQPPHQPPGDRHNDLTVRKENNHHHKKTRNEPSTITNVLQSVARLRNQPAAIIAQASNHNACQLFNLPDSLTIS